MPACSLRRTLSPFSSGNEKAGAFLPSIIDILDPLLLKKLNFDPAISTGPFVTTAIDILGVAFYFIVAGVFINAV